MKMQKRSNPTQQQLGAKRLRQQQLQRGGLSLDNSSGDKTQRRFWPCPICNRSFALFRLEEHVNQCLDTSPCPQISPSSPLTTTRDGSYEPTGVELYPPCLEGSVDGRRVSCSVSSVKTSSLPKERGLSVEGNLMQQPSTENEIVEDGGRGWVFPVEEEDRMKAQLRCKLEYSGSNAQRDCERTGLSAASPGTEEDGGNLDEDGMTEGGRDGMVGKDGNGLAMDRPPPGFRLFQRQVQSQARLSMFRNFSSSALQRKPSVTLLQPGMVLFRSWLDLDTQQKFVQGSQSVSHLFRRPTTSGGGKYHIYSMCWGSKWDAKAHRHVATGPEHRIPPWMFELSQKLAQDAHQYTSVYPVDSTYAPDVGLVNFYPVKADELGVIGLGGHQDLDDSGLMPVVRISTEYSAVRKKLPYIAVSVSIGDSMTFFYRRFPPFSRRKSGVSISVDEEAVKFCEDGDAAHNREYQILLESGDVLVFGGKSRLVYHGTRNVQPGTRPPGLHMVPGRLNFTFRQTIAKII